jgi:hypothetical protein
MSRVMVKWGFMHVRKVSSLISLHIQRFQHALKKKLLFSKKYN